MSFRINKYLLLLPLTFSLFGINLNSQEIEEVIVTSTKKAASVQDLALSVQALSTTDLVEAQITETEDMVELIPGMVQAPGVGSGTNIGVRGLIGTAVGANTTASVQTHINGMQVNASVFTTAGFFDVAQMEIFAGPQGTLFGRNATGGIINVTTAPAEHNNEGSIKFDIGEGGQERINYAQNFDLSDRLAMRIAAQSYKKDGQIFNVHTGNDVDTRDTSDWRLTLNFEINDTTDINFVHQEHSADDSRSHFHANYCSRNRFYGCLPWEKGELNAPAMSSGTLNGLFGAFAQTNNFDDEYANTVNPLSIDQINRDFDPHTRQTYSFTNIELTKQFENVELKIKGATGERDYTRTGDVDGSVASNGFTSGVMNAVMNGGVQAAVIAGALKDNAAAIAADSSGATQAAVVAGAQAAYAAAVAAGGTATIPFFNNANNSFQMTLDLPCLDKPHTFVGDSSYECSRAPSEVDQVDINLVSDFDGPLNFVLGAYFWEANGKNKFHTHTGSYNVLRSFDLHPLSQYFGAGNPFGATLAGQGYGGLAFHQAFFAWAASGFTATFDIEAAGLSDLTFQQYLNTIETIAPNTFVRTLPLELGGLVQDNPVTQRSEAIYGNIFYDISDDTRLTLGYRTNDDSYNSLAFNILGDGTNADYVYSPVYNVNLVGGTIAETNEKFRNTGQDTAETFKIALQHNLNDDTMVYGSLSTGNKPGGSTPDQFGNNSAFNKETVDSFELGLRSIMMDGALLMNLTAFSMDFKDAHYSQIVGSAAITNSIDYQHNGLEGQMKLFLSESTSVDLNFLALDSTIGDGESLFNPLNPNGASEILDIYNLTVAADVGRMAAALDAAITAGTVSPQDLFLPNPVVAAAGEAACNQLAAAGAAAGANGVFAATYGCGSFFNPGSGAAYLGFITSNPAAAGLLPFALFANTDQGFVATFQGFKLTENRWLAQDSLSALPMPWLASEKMVDLAGYRTPYTSELDYNIAINHSMPVLGGNLDLKLTFTHKGDSNGDLFDSMNTYVPEQEYIDIYGNWTPRNGDYFVGFYVKNLDDNRQLHGARTTSELVGGPVNAYFTQPRTAGVTFGINF